MHGTPPKRGSIPIRTSASSKTPVPHPAWARRLPSLLSPVNTVVSARNLQGETLGQTVAVLWLPGGERPRVLVAVAETDPLADAIRSTGTFAVSILSEAQTAVVQYRFGPTGLPLVSGAVAHLECSVTSSFTPEELLVVFVGKLDEAVHWSGEPQERQ